VIHPWTNYATQFNWALDNLPLAGEWILRIDADEYFDDPSLNRLPRVLAELPEDIKGVLVDRQMYFLGKPMRHGSSQTKQLRIWRSGFGRCESRWMDGHIVISEGATVDSGLTLIDNNLNSISWWISKHNSYASREAVDELARRNAYRTGPAQSLPNAQARRKRWIKANVYGHLPLILRPLLYFLFRFIFCFGFLDGAKGFVFHFMQGLWYRMLVDVKVYEVEFAMRAHGKPLPEAVRDRLGINMDQLV
jgi:hypothetical protein